MDDEEQFVDYERPAGDAANGMAESMDAVFHFPFTRKPLGKPKGPPGKGKGKGIGRSKTLGRSKGKGIKMKFFG